MPSSTGAALDAWLNSSAPVRKIMDKGIAQTMAQLNLPTRDDISRLAERLTHIEMRLDDMDAKLDESLAASAKPAARKTAKASAGENLK